MGQTALQYAEKGYRGRAKPVNRKNESHGLRNFLRPPRTTEAKNQK